MRVWEFCGWKREKAPGQPHYVTQKINSGSELDAYFNSSSQDTRNIKTTVKEIRQMWQSQRWEGVSALAPPRLHLVSGSRCPLGQLAWTASWMARGGSPFHPLQNQALRIRFSNCPPFCICLDVLHLFEACICFQTMRSNFKPV